MWVVKLGGSLGEDEALKHWLETIARFSRGRVVIVPGGGRFADQVRNAQKRWQFSDHTAHAMAVLAMHQFGRMLNGLEPGLELAVGAESVKNALSQLQSCIWLPDLNELEHAGIPTRWEVTSDSLSAWLASQINADRLFLIKSAPKNQLDKDLPDLVKSGVMDGLFLHFAPSSAQIECWHRSQYGAFARRLKAVQNR